MKMKVAKVLSIKPQAIKKVFVFLSSEPSSDEKISSEMVSFELEDERRDLNYFEVREQDSILVLLWTELRPNPAFSPIQAIGFHLLFFW